MWFNLCPRCKDNNGVLVELVNDYRGNATCKKCGHEETWTEDRQVSKVQTEQPVIEGYIETIEKEVVE